MARRLVVEIVGDASSLQRSFRGASRTSSHFGRDLERTGRGALAATVSFRGLGRALFFASSAFLGGAGLGYAVNSAIAGAEELRHSQESLSVAIRHTGGNVRALVPFYEKTAKAAADLGISQGEATRGLARATVLTGSAVSAMRAYREAVVISKATGKDFNQTLTATSKAQEGIVTSLRRYGILVDKSTSGQKQFEMVMARFGGQAKANTSQLDQLRAVVTNFTANVGSTFLPSLERVAGRFADWLANSRNQQAVIGKLSAIVQTAASVIRGFAAAAATVAGAFGGWKSAITIAVGAWVGFKVAGVGAAVAVQVANLVAAEAVATAWKAALISTGWGALAVAAGIAAAYAVTHWRQVKGWFTTFWRYLKATALAAWQAVIQYTKMAAFSIVQMATFGIRAVLEVASHLPFVGGQARRALNAINAAINRFRPNFANVTDAFHDALIQGARAAIPGVRNIMGDLFPSRFPPRTPGGGGGGGGRAPTGPGTQIPNAATTVAKGFTLPFRLQLAKAKAEATKTMKDDIAVARQIRVYLLKIIPTLHGQKLLDAYGLLAQANATLTGQVKKAAQKATSWSEPLKLQLELAKAEALGRPTRAILNRMKAAALRAIRSGHLSLQAQIDAWNEIANINQQLQDTAKKALNHFRQLNTQRITAGLDLTPAQRAALRARLSQIGPRGTVPALGYGAYGQIIGDRGRPIDVHTTVNLDGKKVAENTTRHRQRHRRRNSRQRRGPNAGG